MVNPLEYLSGHGLIRKISTKTIINPLLWSFGAALIFALIINIFSADLLTKLFSLSIVFILLIAILVAYFYFAVKEPNRLQSEEHIEQMTLLSYQGHKGKNKNIDIVAPVPLPESLNENLIKERQNDAPDSLE